MASSRDQQTDSFIYPPLDKATRSIRLLSFTDPPLSSPERLHFTLDVHKLPIKNEQAREHGQRAKFVALSYVWGEPTPECSIIVNGKYLTIRENLYALLQVLHANMKLWRKRSHLWADAICIDQKSSEEKNHQVNMMGDIYIQADYVVAWLGQAADQSKLAMDYLREAVCDEDEVEETWGGDLEPEAVDALTALLNRPYWQRLWIAQEFALAKRLLLLCGNSAVTLHGDRGFERISAILSWVPARPIAAMEFLGTRHTLEQTYDNGTMAELHCMVHESMDHGCENLLDRVFALLALHHQRSLQGGWLSDDPRLTADYEVTPERLLYRVLAECGGYCSKKYDAVREMQEALNVPDCDVATVEDANTFVRSVSGFEDYRSLEEEERVQFQYCQGSKLIQMGIIRERSAEEVIGHLKKLTGLRTEDMLRNPESTYLEILGRLFNYRRDGTESCKAWHTFKGALKRSLGISDTVYDQSEEDGLV